MLKSHVFRGGAEKRLLRPLQCTLSVLPDAAYASPW